MQYLVFKSNFIYNYLPQCLNLSSSILSTNAVNQQTPDEWVKESGKRVDKVKKELVAALVIAISLGRDPIIY